MMPSLWLVPEAYPLPGILNDQLIRFGSARMRTPFDWRCDVAGDIDGPLRTPRSPLTVRTTFAVFCSLSAYLVASTTCSSG